MSNMAVRYLELVDELRSARLDRQLEGGELRQSEEAEFVSELDFCWNEMTIEEQEAVERQLAQGSIPVAPDDLSTMDVDVDVGSDIAPRTRMAA